MGSYLNKPVTEKFIIEGRNNKLSYGACTMQGWRRSQEDTFDCNMQFRKDVSLFAVYDGHGGGEVATYCKEHLPLLIRKHWNNDYISKTLEDAILDLDEQIRQESSNTDLESIAQAFPQASETEKYILREKKIREKMAHLLQDIILSKDGELSDSSDDISCDSKCVSESESISSLNSSGLSENDESATGNEQVAKEEGDDADVEESTESDDCSHEECHDAEVEKTKESDNSCHPPGADAKVEEKNDSEHFSHDGYFCGTTAVIALLTDAHLYVANVGDSKCVLSRSGRAHEMTVDHKPTVPSEKKRIIEAGGHVVTERVNGALAISRALGDHAFKSENLPPHDRMVSAVPDVKIVEMNPETDEFIFLATDGVWDVMTPEEATDFVRKRLGRMSLSAIGEEMFNTIMPSANPVDELGSDNMTCIIVKPNFPNSSKVSTAVAAVKRRLSEENDDEVSCSKKHFKKAE